MSARLRVDSDKGRCDLDVKRGAPLSRRPLPRWIRLSVFFVCFKQTKALIFFGVSVFCFVFHRAAAVFCTRRPETQNPGSAIRWNHLSNTTWYNTCFLQKQRIV